MKRSYKTSIFAATLAFCLFAPGAVVAQTRPADAVIVLDVSGSMRAGSVLAEVRSYLETEVVRSLLKPGDRATLIVFGEKPRVLFSRDLRTESDLAELATLISGLRADDEYTDLGLALENLESALASRADGSYRPIALFITDGKNAPAPGSPYVGADLSVDARFKDIGRKIAMKGWQLYVVGLGEETDAAVVAAAVENSTVAPPAAALSTESLSTYAQETAKKTEERAEAVAAQSTAMKPAESAPLPWWAIIVLVAVLGGVAVFIIVRARKPKDDDTKKPPV